MNIRIARKVIRRANGVLVSGQTGRVKRASWDNGIYKISTLQAAMDAWDRRVVRKGPPYKENFLVYDFDESE